MPHSEETSAKFGMMWLMIIGVIVCIIVKSPLAFVFAFAFAYCFFGMLKQITRTHEQGVSSEDGDAEMQPLDKIRGDMTLGELLARY